MTTLRLPLVAALTAFFAFHLAAQSAGWAGVKSIPPGSELKVETAAKVLIAGSLQEVKDDSLVLSLSSGPQTISRVDIERVSVKRANHRLRNVVVGVATGSAVGLGVGIVSGQCKSFCIVSEAEVTTALTGVGAILGVIVGGLIPTGGWREVYKQ